MADTSDLTRARRPSSAAHADPFDLDPPDDLPPVEPEVFDFDPVPPANVSHVDASIHETPDVALAYENGRAAEEVGDQLTPSTLSIGEPEPSPPPVVMTDPPVVMTDPPVVMTDPMEDQVAPFTQVETEPSESVAAEPSSPASELEAPSYADETANDWDDLPPHDWQSAYRAAGPVEDTNPEPVLAAMLPPARAYIIEPAVVEPSPTQSEGTAEAVVPGVWPSAEAVEPEDGEAEGLDEDELEEEPSATPRRRRLSLPHLSRTGAALAVILVAAAVLRFMGLDWDLGHHLHPDERFITSVASAIKFPPLDQYFNTPKSTLNPNALPSTSYVYGDLPLFVNRIVGDVIQNVAQGIIPADTANAALMKLRLMSSYDGAYLLGRALNGLYDLITILFIFLIARRLFSTRVALVASVLAAFTALQIQHSHYFVVENALTALVTISLYFAIRAAQTGTIFDFAMLGVTTGLGMASKVSAAMLALIFAVTAGLIWYRARIGLYERQRLVWEDIFTGLLVAGLLSLATLRITQPYMFSGPGFFGLQIDQRWLDVFTGFQKIGTGESDVPFNQSWAGTTPYIWQLKQMFFWGMGPTLTIAAWLGVVLAGVQLLRNPRQYHLNLIGLVWIALNFGYWGIQFTKLMRYMLPIYPFLTIFAALFVVAAYDWVRHGQWESLFGWRPNASVRRALAFVVPVAVIGWTIFYGIAFTTIYLRPITRIEASQWIYDNLPPGATLGSEHWDDRLPLGMPGKDGGIYKYAEFNNYDTETPEKRQKLLQSLDAADYIVLTSNRLYGSIPKLPQRYPVTTRYYQALFSGELGFEEVKEFTSRPSLLGITLNDDDAEESFTVYEHPKVSIYKKGPNYSSAQVRSILEAVSLDNVIRNLRPAYVGSNGLLLNDEQREAAQEGGTWTDIFDRGSLPNQIPLLFWYLTLQVLALLALPTVWFLCRRLGDAGYPLAKSIAVLVIAYVPWLLASLHVMPYTRWSILLAALLMAVSSAIVIARHRRSFVEAMRIRRMPIIATEVLFTLAFAGFALLRAWNPDLWHSAYGGEKPMDFAYLNAIIKSTYFPPYDPWLAGGEINYYYFGQVIVASLTKLMGIVPWVAYNLAIPTIAALAAINLSSAVYNLLIDGPVAPRTRKRWAVGGGVAAILLALVFGNLAGFVQVVDWLSRVAGEPQQGGLPFITGAIGIGRGLLKLATAGGQGIPPFNFDFWGPTRVITTEGTAPITEFPYFTFLYGDLHAHMIAMPFGLLMVGLAINLLRQPSWTPTFQGRSLRAWLSELVQAVLTPGGLTLILAALTIAVVRMTNSWDYPTYLGLVSLSIFMAEALRKDRDWGTVINRTIVLSLCLLIGAELFARPYTANYVLFYSGVELAKNHTIIPHYLIIMGSFLAIVGVYLGYRLLALRRKLGYGALGALGATSGASTSSGITAASTSSTTYQVAPQLDRLVVGLMGFAAFLAILLAIAGIPVAGLAGIYVAAIALVAALARPAAGTLFTLLLAATALAITGGVEIFVLKGDLGRMNTVFKFYLQAWLFLSIVSGVLLTLMARRAWGSRWLMKGGRRAWAALFVVLIAMTALYPLMGTPSKLQHRFAFLPLSLDGMEYMSVAKYEDDANGKRVDLQLPEDFKAINWMLDNVKGSPTIVEGIAPLYHWRSRVSIYTGLPTVQGWDWHQVQQRGEFGFMVEDRVKDVNTIFTSTDTSQVQSLLKKYGVQYVYVGGQERAFYPPEGVDKFERMVGSTLERVYQDGPVTIYHVVR